RSSMRPLRVHHPTDHLRVVQRRARNAARDAQLIGSHEDLPGAEDMSTTHSLSSRCPGSVARGPVTSGDRDLGTLPEGSYPFVPCAQANRSAFNPSVARTMERHETTFTPWQVPSREG